MWLWRTLLGDFFFLPPFVIIFSLCEAGNNNRRNPIATKLNWVRENFLMNNNLVSFSTKFGKWWWCLSDRCVKRKLHFFFVYLFDSTKGIVWNIQFWMKNVHIIEWKVRGLFSTSTSLFDSISMKNVTLLSNRKMFTIQFPFRWGWQKKSYTHTHIFVLFLTAMLFYSVTESSERVVENSFLVFQCDFIASSQRDNSPPK